MTSTYVPATSVKPAISGKKVIHGRNANDPDQYAFLPDYSGVIVSPQNASYADNWKVTSSDDSIAEYVESMVKGYVPYKAGTVTYRATLTQTDPETKKESTVYILSANAAAETGQIINIDGSGNRLSESLFGPKRVYYVIGKNKIAPDLSSAMDRARNIACPKNAARFNKKTPCVVSDDKKVNSHSESLFYKTLD